jgi:hypothetical protein
MPGPKDEQAQAGSSDAYNEGKVLERRSVYFPISIGHPGLAREVLGIAADLAVGDVLSAERRATALIRTAAPREAQRDLSPEERVAPHLRAQALARILIDLSNNSWSVAIEDGQVYLRAPSWVKGTAGMSVEAVRLEKERSRRSLVSRVEEQLERPTTREFIGLQERLHFGAGGSRSIASLIADGPSLAASLRLEGADCIKPYLQVADADAGRDAHTGLKLWDVFRYFRYHWSFPYESTPGRTLPFLIRDAGQPVHPVCGLLCLSSPIPKLTARDSALGWTPQWLEAIVAALEFSRDSLRSHLLAIDAALRAGQTDSSVQPARVLADLSSLLGVKPTHDPTELARSLLSLGSRQLSARVTSARRRIIKDLVGELESAIKAIATTGLGITTAGALANPGRVRGQLMRLADGARDEWLESRSIKNSTRRPRRVTADDLRTSETLSARGEDPLFRKKRVSQLAGLLAAWEDMEELADAPTAEVLRAHTLGADSRGNAGLTGGAKVRRGLRTALAQRQSRFVASQVADVSVCGALPPYGPLLGGKLAAMLAMSRELSSAYLDRYSNQVSEIGSQMAHRPVCRPAELVSLSTTSFYAVGSSQYNRVRLPESLGGGAWELVGESRGHGTMHFSRETSELLSLLMKVESGRELITSTFGEGPSERLRKIRDGLERLGLPAGEILQHGMPRLVYVAELGAMRTRPGGARKSAAWSSSGPTAADIAAHWRERWLGPRIARTPELLEALREFKAEDTLLSRRLRRPIHQQLDLLTIVKQ